MSVNIYDEANDKLIPIAGKIMLNADLRGYERLTPKFYSYNGLEQYVAYFLSDNLKNYLDSGDILELIVADKTDNKKFRCELTVDSENNTLVSNWKDNQTPDELTIFEESREVNNGAIAYCVKSTYVNVQGTIPGQSNADTITRSMDISSLLSAIDFISNYNLYVKVV